MPELDLERKPDKGRTLLIWDAEGSPPVGAWTTVLWNSFGKKDDSTVISISKLVEDQADSLRARYLAWIYELGEMSLEGKRLVDHLELRPGFSFWWMTSFAQKTNILEVSPVNNAIKAFALESLVSEDKIISIHLVSSNSRLAVTLRNFCDKSDIRFKSSTPISKGKPALTMRLLYGSLPAFMRSLICYLWYLLRCLPLLCAKKPSLYPLNGEISFVDILVHLNGQAFKTGKFISNYWTSLLEMLFRSNVKTNWLHNYYSHESIPSLARAQKLIGRFNKCGSEIQSHALIESNLNLSVFVKALKDYFRTSGASIKLSRASRHFRPTCSALDLWPLFKHEWVDSLRGESAMLNCLRVSLFEKTFSAIPYQKFGVYIQENQPWEMALIFAWKAAGHGKLVGVPHTSVRFWDLRYFYDSRSYVRTGKNDLPIPDQVAVNGPVAKKAYLKGGYSEGKVIEVEALRFLHLLNQNPANASRKIPSKVLNVLICGDILSAANNQILSCLSIAAQSLPPDISFVFKPHPASSIKISDYKFSKLEVTKRPLPELLTECDVVFTSNMTSAAVDAYCSGIPVVQMLDGNTFNMSPLRDLKGVVYVTNPMELAEALRHAQHRECVVAEPYFCLDEELPRWSRLLGLRKANAK